MPACTKVRSITVVRAAVKVVYVTCPAHISNGCVTLVAVKKIRTASGTMMMPMVLNWRARNASAPSWIALAMSCILAVP